MSTMHDQPDNTAPLPEDLASVAHTLETSAAAARREVTPAMINRLALATWPAAQQPLPSAPLPFAMPAPRASLFTPLRLAAMLAIGAGLLASILALRSAPSSLHSSPASIARAPAQATPLPADELAMFDTYLASADAGRSALDAFVEDASELEDRFDALSTGQDWWSDADPRPSQGAS